MDFGELALFHERHLLEQVMPFWTRHCIDWDCGGINNCVSDEGQVLSTDKYLWSQGRALWTFSALYNRLDGDPQWLRVADNIAGFLMEHGRCDDGAWAFCLRRDGSVAIPPQSVYADAFCMAGLTEYARATGRRQALGLALETFERTSPLLEDHSGLPAEPHPIPEGFQAHGPLMIFAHFYHDLGVLAGEERILARALDLAERIMTQHVKPERRLLYELVRPGGGLDESDAGNTFLPGHAVESMWFLERIYRHHYRPARMELATDVIRWHLEKGWDEECGGLFLARHACGGTPVWHQPDAKCWWPHTEALYALLVAHNVTGAPWAMDWYWRVHEYAFRMFPNCEHGEWRQNLDRQGRPIPVVLKNLAVKDPFHLPRALLLCRSICREMNGGA